MPEQLNGNQVEDIEALLELIDSMPTEKEMWNRIKQQILKNQKIVEILNDEDAFWCIDHRIRILENDEKYLASPLKRELNKLRELKHILEKSP